MRYNVIVLSFASLTHAAHAFPSQPSINRIYSVWIRSQNNIQISPLLDFEGYRTCVCALENVGIATFPSSWSPMRPREIRSAFGASAAHRCCSLHRHGGNIWTNQSPAERKNAMSKWQYPIQSTFYPAEMQQKKCTRSERIEIAAGTYCTRWNVICVCRSNGISVASNVAHILCDCGSICIQITCKIEESTAEPYRACFDWIENRASETELARIKPRNYGCWQ